MKAAKRQSLVDKVGKEKLSRARNLIVTVYISQFKRRCFILLMRAFMKWSKEYSLYLKCNELSKQLKERTFALEDIRKSYLRDVVNVKIYLEKITSIDVVEVDKYNYLTAIASSGMGAISSTEDEIELSPYQQQQRQIQEQQVRQLRIQQNEIRDITVGVKMMPTCDLRSMIKRAAESVNDTSAQLRENLIEAGLMDVETMRTLNPWEQGSAYTRAMKVKRGHFFNLPNPGGESIPLSAPSHHRLFVKYCSDCVGIINLVRSWNAEVEDALRFRIEYGAMDQQNAELRKLIAKLNGIIENQEKDLIKEVAKNKELEEANAWFHNWTDTKKVSAISNELKDTKRQLTEVQLMAQSDVESTALNVTMSLRSRIASALSAEETLYKVIRKERLSKEMEVKARLQMYDDLLKCQAALSDAEKEKLLLAELRDNETERVNQMQRQTAALNDTIASLERACLFKDNSYAELRAESILKIDFLKQQIGDLSFQCSQLEKKYEGCKEEARHLKIENEHINSSLQFFVEQKEAAVLNEAARSRNGIKRRITMRVLGIAVRMVVRFCRSFRRKELQNLGMVGYKIMARQSERKEARTKAIIENLREKNAELESTRSAPVDAPRFTTGSSLNEHEMGSVLRKFMRSSFTMNLGIEMEEMTEEQFQNVVNSKHYDKFTEDILGKFTNNILKTRILAQMQRNMAHQLAKAVMSARAMIANLDIDNETAKLKASDTKVSPAKVLDKGSKLKPLGRIKDLKRKLVLKGNTLMRWIKSNKRKTGKLMPFKIPFDIVDEIKRVPKGRRTERNQYSYKIISLHMNDKDQVESITDQLNGEMRKVENYIDLLKSKIAQLTADNQEAMNKIAQSLNDDLYLNGAGRGPDYDFLNRQNRNKDKNSQEKLLSLKSSLVHLLDDPNGASKYLASLVNAIEIAQKEEDMSKLDGDADIEGTPTSGKKKKKKGTSISAAVANDVFAPSNGVASPAQPSSMHRKKTLLLDRIVPLQLQANQVDKPRKLSIARASSVPTSLHAESPNSQPPAMTPSIEPPDSPQFDLQKIDTKEKLPRQQSITSHKKISPKTIISNAGATSGSPSNSVSNYQRSSRRAGSRDNVQNEDNNSLSLSNHQSNHSEESIRRGLGKRFIDKCCGTSDDIVGSYYNGIQNGDQLFSRSIANVSIYAGLDGPSDHRECDEGDEGDELANEASAMLHRLNGGISLQKTQLDDEEEDDEDEDEEDEDEFEDDEDRNDLSPLEIAKLEAVAILRHEQRLAKQIKAKQRENQYLLTDLQVLTNKLEDQKKKFRQSTIEQEQINDDVSKLAKEYEVVKRQNALLREVVEDSYKNQVAAVEKAIEEKNLEMQDREKKRLAFFAEKGTQIACVVCAKKDPHHSFGPVDGPPLVHESMARALDAEVVLVANPRHINGILSLSHPYQNRVGVNTTPTVAFTSPSGPADSSQSNSPDVANLPLVKSTTHHHQRPYSADRYSPTPATTNSHSNVVGVHNQMQSQGLPPRPSSAYSTMQKSSSLPLVGYGGLFSSSNAAELTMSPSADQSKFSRINQMPRKVTTSSPSADFHAKKTSHAQKMQAIKKGKIPSRNVELRTVSNTAAYLQGKILADSNFVALNEFNKRSNEITGLLVRDTQTTSSYGEIPPFIDSNEINESMG